MGIIIKATGISKDSSVKSSITHAALAAKSCISAADVPLDGIDLLINTGVYRDANMAEPAMAALIQKEIGLSLDYIKQASGHFTLSFDLMNGPCGMLNAVQVASAVIAAGSGRRALLVSSDAHPSNQEVRGFPYAAVGSAMLLERDDDGERGFGRVEVQATSDDFIGAEGFVPFAPEDKSGRARMTIAQHPEYKWCLLDWAARATAAYAAAERVDLGKTLLVTSQCTSDFGPELARRLGMNEQAAVRVTGIEGDPHTSSLVFAYDAARASGLDRKYAQILFVAAGGGLTAAIAVYRP